MRRDVLSAYCASFARIASWVIVSAIVYRKFGADAFALFTLVRATVGLLAYAAIGISPALISRLASQSSRSTIPVEGASQARILHYESTQPTPAVLYSTANCIVVVLAIAGIFLGLGYGLMFERIHSVPSAWAGRTTHFVWLMSCGVILRIMSDASSAVLQVNGKIALDNGYLIFTELFWAASTAGVVLVARHEFYEVALMFAVANLLLLVLRFQSASRIVGNPRVGLFRWSVATDLAKFGGLVVLAQLADYLYAPTDYILINHLLDTASLAAYAPAVQIDGGLLLLVSGLAMVLLPRAAIAHANENRHALRRYYIVGTLFSFALLVAASIGLYFIAPILFKLWFGNRMSPTRAILPLILIHTIVGGSSIVGRSILLGMGKVRPFTISVLIAGVSNVLLSWLFVAKFHLGLRGIVLGTIVAVVARAGIWMPWYVMRTLNQKPADGESSELEAPVIPSI